MIRVRLPASGRKVFAAALVVIVLYPLAAHFTLARARSDTDGGEPAVSVSLPLQAGFFDGATALYITPEVGVDPNAPAAIIAAAKQVAEGFNSNFIPQNFGVLPGSTAVDDIFVFTNFAQGNVLASAPHPAGPANSDTNYSPLWHPGSPDARSRRHVSLSLSKSSGWTGRCHPQGSSFFVRESGVLDPALVQKFGSTIRKAAPHESGENSGDQDSRTRAVAEITGTVTLSYLH